MVFSRVAQLSNDEMEHQVRFAVEVGSNASRGQGDKRKRYGVRSTHMINNQYGIGCQSKTKFNEELGCHPSLKTCWATERLSREIREIEMLY